METIRKSEHYLWCERFRPRQLSEFIGNELLISKVNDYIKTEELPNMLLYGSAGTGKTSLAKILVNSLPCEYLYINASDDRTIDTIRDKIVGFASTVSLKPLRVIILDEADYLPALSQAALRNVIETYSLRTRFILTCNYIERMSSPIVSRCATFKIEPPSKEEVAGKLIEILNTLKVEYALNDIIFVVNSYYPDIRKIINYAQQYTIENKLIFGSDESIKNDYKEQLIDLLKKHGEKNIFNEIRQLIADAAFSNYDEVYRHLFDSVDVFSGDKQACIILELADAVYHSAIVVEKEIIFVAAMQRILTCLNEH
jgi:DNA polymerase III delta prime subunit